MTRRGFSGLLAAALGALGLGMKPLPLPACGTRFTRDEYERYWTKRACDPDDLVFGAPDFNDYEYRGQIYDDVVVVRIGPVRQISPESSMYTVAYIKCHSGVACKKLKPQTIGTI